MSRTYKKLVDVFADVGGVSEVITFFIAILYSWYNATMMEKFLVNYGILRSDQISDNLERDDLKQRKPFSFCEILVFSYLGCCFKRSKRFQLYEASLEKAEERTDFLSFIRTQGNNEAMIDSLFQPYQRKLIQFVKLDSSNHENMDLEDALTKLSRSNGKSEVQKAIDKWLVENIDLKSVGKLADSIPDFGLAEINNGIENSNEEYSKGNKITPV